MNALGYNALAALAVAGAVIVSIAADDAVLATALVGLAGTIAGRGAKDA